MIIFLLTMFVISIVLLIPTILLQTNGADNGVMSSQAIAGAFGARSNEILVKFTAYCVTVFIVSALLLSINFIRASNIDYSIDNTQTVREEVLPVDDNVGLPLAE
ncbi:MAG: preprotein translocase subunit SecG [Brevinema sp.]